MTDSITELNELRERLERDGKLPEVPGGVARLKIKEVEQFEEYLSTSASAIYNSPMHTTTHSFPAKTGGWKQVQCQFLSITVEGGKGDVLPKPEHVEQLAKLFNRAVELELVGWGCLTKAVFLPLATLDVRVRGMLLLYTYSDLPRDVLNERLGVDNFVEEGAIPPPVV